MPGSSSALPKKDSKVRSRKPDDSTSSPLISVELVDESYNEDEDPDYTLRNTQYNPSDDEFSDDDGDDDDDKDELESELSELNEELSISSSADDLNDSKLQNQLKVPSLFATESTSTANLILDTHKHFKKFIHKHEVPRKVFHVSIGFITLYLYTINIQTPSLVAPLATGFISVGSLDLIRFRFPEFNKLYCKSVGFLMREKEVNTYNGVIWYLLGLTIVFFTSKKDIAVMAVLLLSWSDTAASTFGRLYGHLTPRLSRNKSLAGSIAAFLVGVLSAYLFYGYFVPAYPEVNDIKDYAFNQNTSYLNLHTLAFLSGIVAAGSEAIDLFGWDDNFTIPVFSSIFLTAVVKAAS
ncbi:hypothetical protein CANARDRAFT_26451, partial [[Candida] arabinofermentans NRRL YB-2248]